MLTVAVLETTGLGDDLRRFVAVEAGETGEDRQRRSLLERFSAAIFLLLRRVGGDMAVLGDEPRTNPWEPFRSGGVFAEVGLDSDAVSDGAVAPVGTLPLPEESSFTLRCFTGRSRTAVRFPAFLALAPGLVLLGLELEEGDILTRPLFSLVGLDREIDNRVLILDTVG